MEIDLLIKESEYDSQYPINFQMVSYLKQFSIPHLKHTLKPTFMVFKMNILKSEMVLTTSFMPMAGTVGHALKDTCPYQNDDKLMKVGMAMGGFFLGTRPALPLMGRDLILLNGFGTGMRFLFKTRGGFGTGSGIALSRPAPIIYKI